MQYYGNHIVPQTWGGYIAAGISASVTNNSASSNATVTVVGRAGFWWIDGWSYAEIDTTGGGAYRGGINGGSGSESYIVDSAQAATASFSVPKRTGSYSYTVTVTLKINGQTSSVSMDVTIPALSSFYINYNANGGSGAPNRSLKYYGIDINLSSNVPTLTGYKCIGWATSASRANSGIVDYDIGAKYHGNSETTLYAVWEAQASTLNPISASNIGSSVAPSWVVNNASFTYKIRFVLGNFDSGEINVGANLSSYTYNIPMSVCNQLPDATSGTMTCTLKTYSGSTLLGTSTRNFIVNVPPSVIPTFTYSFSEGIESGFGVFASTLSSLQATLSTSGSYGSTVVSAHMTIENKTYEVDVENNIAVITSSVLMQPQEHAEIELSIIDSRNRRNMITVPQQSTITVYEYFRPRIQRTDISIVGTTVTVYVEGLVASVNNRNHGKLSATRRKISGGGSGTIWTDKSVNYIFNVNNEDNPETILDINAETYEYTFALKDDVTSSPVYVKKATGLVCISRYAGGRGVTLFKEASQEGFLVEDVLYLDNSIYDEVAAYIGESTAAPKTLAKLLKKLKDSSGGSNIILEGGD